MFSECPFSLSPFQKSTTTRPHNPTDFKAKRELFHTVSNAECSTSGVLIPPRNVAGFLSGLRSCNLCYLCYPTQFIHHQVRRVPHSLIFRPIESKSNSYIVTDQMIYIHSDIIKYTFIHIHTHFFQDETKNHRPPSAKWLNTSIASL